MQFEPFGKIARLKRECLITEKIDGTNAQVVIVDMSKPHEPLLPEFVIAQVGDMAMLAGSRSRYLTPNADGAKGDNFGFAKWVQANADDLVTLGPGRHYGEWWGSGIQRGYGLMNGEKRFSLFNAWRWGNGREAVNPNKPKCCSVVPVLHSGAFSTDATEKALDALICDGSKAAPGFLKPEGIVIYLSAARCYFKQTIERDEEPKGKTLRDGEVSGELVAQDAADAA